MGCIRGLTEMLIDYKYLSTNLTGSESSFLQVYGIRLVSVSVFPLTSEYIMEGEHAHFISSQV